MDDTKKQLEELTAAIHERMAALDAPVRDLILSNEYIINLKNIINAHSLNDEQAGKLEEITTNFLLGTIEPKELENIFIETFNTLNKDQIRSLFNEIKIQILKPVWDFIEKAWKEDDEREELFKEVVELAEVPLPPNLQEKDIQTLGQKVEKQIDQKPVINKTPEPAVIPNKSWVSKIEEDTQNQTMKIISRSEKDRTLPKIGINQVDPYREIPEE